MERFLNKKGEGAWAYHDVMCIHFKDLDSSTEPQTMLALEKGIQRGTSPHLSMRLRIRSFVSQCFSQNAIVFSGDLHFAKMTEESLLRST